MSLKDNMKKRLSSLIVATALLLTGSSTVLASGVKSDVIANRVKSIDAIMDMQIYIASLTDKYLYLTGDLTVNVSKLANSGMLSNKFKEDFKNKHCSIAANVNEIKVTCSRDKIYDFEKSYYLNTTVDAFISRAINTHTKSLTITRPVSSEAYRSILMKRNGYIVSIVEPSTGNKWYNPIEKVSFKRVNGNWSQIKPAKRLYFTRNSNELADLPSTGAVLENGDIALVVSKNSNNEITLSRYIFIDGNWFSVNSNDFFLYDGKF